MPITIKQQQLRYKDPITGTYKGLDVLSEGKAGQQIASIQAVGEAQISAISSSGDTYLTSISTAQQTLSSTISQAELNAESAFNSFVASKETQIIQLVDGVDGDETKKGKKGQIASLVDDEENNIRNLVGTATRDNQNKIISATGLLGQIVAVKEEGLLAIQNKADDITQLARQSVADVADEKIGELAKNITVDKIIMANGDNTWSWKDAPYVLNSSIIKKNTQDTTIWASGQTQDKIAEAVTNLAQNTAKDKIIMTTSANTWGWVDAPYVLNSNIIKKNTQDTTIWASGQTQDKITEAITNLAQNIVKDKIIMTTSTGVWEWTDAPYILKTDITDGNTTGQKLLWASDTINTKLTTITNAIAALPTINDTVQNDQDVVGTNLLWSSQKIKNKFDALPVIDNDNTNSTSKLWSASKIYSYVKNIKTLDDNATATNKVWSSNKIQNELNPLQQQLIITETISGSTATINAQKNHIYMCGTLTSLTIYPPSDGGIFEVIFTSGSTATTLSLDNSIKIPTSFKANALQKNTTYEINVMNNLAVVGVWQ